MERFRVLDSQRIYPILDEFLNPLVSLNNLALQSPKIRRQIKGIFLLSQIFTIPLPKLFIRVCCYIAS